MRHLCKALQTPPLRPQTLWSETVSLARCSKMVDNAAGKLERLISDEVRQMPTSFPEKGDETAGLNLLYGGIMQHIVHKINKAAPGCQRETTSEENPMTEHTTTIMIRNIPNRFSQQALIKELNSLGLESRFDFVYIPIDIRTMANVGYAFVNFLESCDAQHCLDAMQGHKFQRQGGKASRAQSACVANVQGLEPNLENYKRAAQRNNKLLRRRPVVALGGLPSSTSLDS